MAQRISRPCHPLRGWWIGLTADESTTLQLRWNAEGAAREPCVIVRDDQLREIADGLLVVVRKAQERRRRREN